MTLTNKEKVVQLLKGLETGDTSAYAYKPPEVCAAQSWCCERF